MQRLETILTLTRDLGVNLAGVEVILNLQQQMEQMRSAVDRLVAEMPASRRSATPSAAMPWYGSPSARRRESNARARCYRTGMPASEVTEAVCSRCGGRGWVVEPDGGAGKARPCGCG